MNKEIKILSLEYCKIGLFRPLLKKASEISQYDILSGCFLWGRICYFVQYDEHCTAADTNVHRTKEKYYWPLVL